MNGAAAILAAARAGYAGPVDPALLTETAAVASRTGRRVVELPGRQVVVGWADGYGPNLDDGELVVARLSRTRLVALGVCLGLCWDPDGPRFPGREITDAQFDAQVEELGVPVIHVKGALPGLHEAGLVRLYDGRIALGAALAQWTDASWNELRVLRAQLPGGSS